jgi:hypothetical protein
MRYQIGQDSRYLPLTNLQEEKEGKWGNKSTNDDELEVC